MHPSEYALTHESIDVLSSMMWYYYEEGYRMNGDPRHPGDPEYENYRKRYEALRRVIDYVVQWKWPTTEEDDAEITYHPENEVDLEP